MKPWQAHPSAIVDDGCVIGRGTYIWHFSHIMPGAEIGENCILGQNVFVAPGVKLGNGVKVQNNVSLYTGVICEDNVFLGPSMVFTNVLNPRANIERKDEFRPTIIRVGATIGANATLICGNEIGQYAMVAAGAVVSRPVKPFSLVMGTPARHKSWISRRGHKLAFDAAGMASCPESGEKYILSGNEVSLAIL